MFRVRAAECYLLGSDSKCVLSLSRYRSTGSFPKEQLREQMHSSVISSVTVIGRENPIYLLNELLEISPFTLAKEEINEFLV